MKHAPNYMPYEDQSEGFLKLVHHKISDLLIGKETIISDGENIYPAICKRKESDCAYMETLDGRPFRITQNSKVQGYYAYFENKTDKSRKGSEIGNFWFITSSEKTLSLFKNKDLKSYILWDNTTKELCKYPEKEERSDRVYQKLGRSLDFQLGFRFC